MAHERRSMPRAGRARRARWFIFSCVLIRLRDDCLSLPRAYRGYRYGDCRERLEPSCHRRAHEREGLLDACRPDAFARSVFGRLPIIHNEWGGSGQAIRLPLVGVIVKLRSSEAGSTRPVWSTRAAPLAQVTTERRVVCRHSAINTKLLNGRIAPRWSLRPIGSYLESGNKTQRPLRPSWVDLPPGGQRRKLVDPKKMMTQTSRSARARGLQSSPGPAPTRSQVLPRTIR
jgi:hypothetical protein